MNERRVAILIVEDDQDLRETVAELLEGEGYSVATAAHGGEALELLLRTDEKPALILLDLMMPVMDGRQFRAEQLKHSDIAEIPVVVMTADGNAREKAALLRADGLLQKPLKIETMLTLLSTVTRGRPKAS